MAHWKTVNNHLLNQNNNNSTFLLFFFSVVIFSKSFLSIFGLPFSCSCDHWNNINAILNSDRCYLISAPEFQMHVLNWVTAWRLPKTTTCFNFLLLLRFYQDQAGYNKRSGILKNKLCKRDEHLHSAELSTMSSRNPFSEI